MDRSPNELSPAAVRAGAVTARRGKVTGHGDPWFWIWDVMFGSAYVFGLVVLAGASGTSAGSRLGAAIVYTLIGVWYLAVGRPIARRFAAGQPHGRATWVFVVGLVLLLCPAVWLNQLNTFALFALCSMVFMVLPLGRAAIAITIASLLPPVIGAVRDRSFDKWLYLMPISILGLAFALLIGTYIDRISQQSAERGRLITELEASRAEVARLSHETGVATERARLAGEIHDTLAQGFTSIVTLVQAAESDLGRDEAQVRRRLALALRTARENLGEARALVGALAPSALGSGSLDEAVRRQAVRTGEELGVPVEYTVDGVPDPLPTAVEVVILRAAQEALSNVRRHAAPTRLDVTLSYQDDRVRLTVRDDGRGFDLDRTGTGFGLAGMRQRVEQVAGSLTVASATGAGTRVDVEVPR